MARWSSPRTGKTPHKYHAVRTELDGHSFASKAEAKRYAELKLWQKAGKIRGLQLQPAYELTVDNARYPDNGDGRMVEIGKYVADFTYILSDTERVVIEDVKGVRTALYRWKKKHFEAQYGITVTEIGRR